MHNLRSYSPYTLPRLPSITAFLFVLLHESAPMMNEAHWCADGGGIRGYSALLILQELMKVIGRIERQYASGPSDADGPAESSYHPLVPLSTATVTATNTRSKSKKECVKKEPSPWLPCHYFDYVAGTSTGGCVSYTMYLPAQHSSNRLFTQLNRHYAWTIENEC